MGGTAIDPNLAKEIQEVKNELPAPGQPIRMQLETGEVVEGANWEEVAKKAMKMKVDTTLTLKQQKERADELERQMQATQQRQPAEPAKEGQLDPAKYWALLNENKIVEAQNYADSFRFGIPENQVVETFKSTVTKTDAIWDEVELNRFRMAHPDYPASPEAATYLANKIKEWNVPWDASTLHRAYKDGVEEGKITPLKLEEQPADKGFSGPAPSLGGAGSSTTVGEDEIDPSTLTDEQLKRLLVRKGMLSA